MKQQKFSKSEIIEEQSNVFTDIQVNTLIKNYYAENVAFKQINIGDTIPFDKYFVELELHKAVDFSQVTFIKDYFNIFIENFDKACFLVFCNRINYMFAQAPKYKTYYGDENEIYPFKYGIDNYLKNIYPIFAEIINTEINESNFDKSFDRDALHGYCLIAAEFIIAIKLKKVKQGKRIDRYIKDLPYISPFLMRLIKNNKGKFYLKNDDCDSLDYILALFSCFEFIIPCYIKLFEMKMLKWEQNKKRT